MDQSSYAAFENRELLNEEARLEILDELGILDTDDEAEFDGLTRLARQVSGCKIALISLIDRDRQWFKAKCGLSVSETAREDAFCAHAIRECVTMIVPDAREDDRFRNNPLVTGEPKIVFYAGVPLIIGRDPTSGTGGAAVGTLCVIHDKPHALSPDQQTGLADLARLAETLIERHASALKALALVSEHTAHLRQMHLRNRQFRQAERMANIGSWRLTLADNRTQWSEQVYAIHGLPIGQDPSLSNALDFYPGDARVIVSDALNHAVETGQPFEVETDFVTARGDLRRVRSMGEVELEAGHPVAIIGVFQDVTQQYALEERLRRSAQNDDLTGLPNRAHFNEYLDCRLEKSTKTGVPLWVVLIDLDHFKSVNDKCGHRAGDILLQQFAGKLRTSSLRNSFCARLGGDEFVAVISDPDACDNIEWLLKQLLAGLRVTVEHRNDPLVVTATIGVSQWSADILDGSDLVHRADLALYEAKRARRGSAKIDGLDRFIEASSSAA